MIYLIEIAVPNNQRYIKENLENDQGCPNFFIPLYVFRNKQKSVEDYFQKKKTTPCTPQEAAVLTESVLSMIVKDMRPLAMVVSDCTTVFIT